MTTGDPVPVATYPSVSILLATRREDMLDFALAQVARPRVLLPEQAAGRGVGRRVGLRCFMSCAPARPLTVLALLAAALVPTGCGAAPDPSTSPSTSPSTTTSPRATTPPTTYSDTELVAALPRTEKERQGVPVSDSCRTISRPCRPGDDPGAAFVVASSTPNGIGIVVDVRRRYRAQAWRTQVENCPQGRYERPLQTLSETTYIPGERGTSKRTPFTAASWSGFTCSKSIVRLFPDGEESERTTDFSAAVNNRRHTLFVRGRTLAETESLAAEYLERLGAAVPE